MSEILMGYATRKLLLLSMTTLALAGCGWSPTLSAREDARILFQTLRANEQIYQQALMTEVQTFVKIRDSLSNGGAVDVPETELTATSRRFEQLYERLDRLHLNARLQQEVLSPILQQLQREREELDDITSLLTSDEAEAARAKLERHRHPLNLFTPAIRKIRENYGIPRPRLWRGHALTA